MKRKVLHVLHAVGGVDVYLRLITKNLNPDTFETVIVHGKTDSRTAYFDSQNNQIKEYQIPIDREINLFKDLNSVYSLVKILRKERPDVIHSHSAKGGIIARLASIFYKVNVLHTPHAYSYLSTQSKLKKRLFLTIERGFKHINSILVATSQSELDRGLKDIGYKKSKAKLFNNSVYPIKQVPPLSIGKTWPSEYICSVGRPSFQKNIELMVDVIFEIKKSKPDIHLVLLGAGLYSPNLEYIKKKIKELDIENNITILGWIDRKDIFNIIHYSTLYLTTSRYEGLPYSVIESLAMGKAIVATNVDGNKDLVKNNFNGFLIDDANKDQISQAVLKLINDDDLRESMGENSQKFFDEKFNMEQNIKILESIYLNN